MHTRYVKIIEQQVLPPFELKTFPRHAAFLFCGVKLVAVSLNQYGRHAEVGLIPYMRPNERYRLYVTRMNTDTKQSRPCQRCATMLKRVPCALRVFYTDAEGEWIEDARLDSEHVPDLHRTRREERSAPKPPNPPALRSSGSE